MNTPERMDTLPEDSIFVFGSNLQGNHAGGAAALAYERFGAIQGKGVGIQGQSYAIPTMGSMFETKLYAIDFMEYVRTHPDRTFYLTRVGCGIAGHTDEEMAPLFTIFELDNLIKPVGW